MTLISCLMVTRGALRPARYAIDCYQRQTHADRELIVVCDTRDAPLAAHIVALADPSIRYIETAPAPLGALRNVSVEAAHGPLVCQWDDDDLYAPDRIARQHAALEEAGADACFLPRWLLWQPARRRLALSGRRVWEGSMLARRDALPTYRPLARREDTELVTELNTRARIVLNDSPLAYLYIVHGRNAFETDHYERIFAAATRTWSGRHYDAALEAAAARFPVRAYLAGSGR